MSERKPIIGILLISTGKYWQFVQPLIDSIKQYFLLDYKINIHVFNDELRDYDGDSRVSIQQHGIPSFKFPMATLMRYWVFAKYASLIKEDVLYYLDVDMLVVAPVGDEILPVDTGLVSIVHPGFFNGGYGSNNTHEKSLAYVPPEKRNGYYCGGFQGGTRDSYLRMAKVLSENIEKDFETAKEIGYTENNGILAEWHDESHYNWYLKERNTTESWNILDPSYCYPHWEIPYPKKILALDKDHKTMRE